MTVQEQRLQKEKVRVFELARELDLESKDLMVLCRQNGIELKNQLSTVGPELRDQIVELVKRGPGTAAAQATRTPAAPVLPTVINRKVQTLEARRPAPARPRPAQGRGPGAGGGARRRGGGVPAAPPPPPRPGATRPNIPPGRPAPAPLRPLPPARPLEQKKPAEKTAKPMVTFTKEQLDKIGKQ